MDIEDLRLAVYERFRRGKIPRVADLPTELSTTPEQVGTGLATLAAGRHVALGPDGSLESLDVSGQRGLAEALLSGFTGAASRAAQRAA